MSMKPTANRFRPRYASGVSVPLRRAAMVLAIGAAALVSCGCGTMSSDPVVDHSSTTRKLAALPRHSGRKKVVAIYEFRSSVPEVNAAGATDMFTTALIKSGAFAVAERHRLNQGVMQEKQLNGSGMSTGSAASSRLTGASYIFEGTVSEANQGASQNSGGFNIGGMQIGGGNNKDQIGVDVRILDANNGMVVDSINVSKEIKSAQGVVSGIGNLFNATVPVNGRNVPVDANLQSSRRESVDKALRASIEAAVYELVQRYASE